MDLLTMGLAVYGGWKLVDTYVLKGKKSSRRRSKKAKTRGRRR